MSTIEERIKAALARYPERDDRHISKSLHGVTVAMVRAVRAGQPVPLPPAPAQLPANVSLVSVDDIKRKYDMLKAIMDVIRALPAGRVIAEPELKASVEHPDPYRFKRTLEAHEKELEPYRIMLKYKGHEPKYHYARPEVIADLRRTLETP